MDNSSARDYIYSKVCGLLSKVYTGSNSQKILSVKTLAELYGLLFAKEVPVVPESILAGMIETEAEKRFLDEFVELLDGFQKPDFCVFTITKTSRKLRVRCACMKKRNLFLRTSGIIQCLTIQNGLILQQLQKILPCHGIIKYLRLASSRALIAAWTASI